MNKNSKSQPPIPDNIRKQLIDPNNGDIHDFDEIWDKTRQRRNDFIEPDETEVNEALSSVWERINSNSESGNIKKQTASGRSDEPGRRLPLLAAVILLSFGFHWVDNDDSYQTSLRQHVEMINLDRTDEES